MYYIVIRESQPNDLPHISELVRRAYISNVRNFFFSALFNEVNNTLFIIKQINGSQFLKVTFQAIVLLAAFMFIFMGVPLFYCLFAIPLVLIMTYILIYGAILMKSAELMHGKRALQCWVAEAYEPYFFIESPTNCTYRIIPEDKMGDEGVMEETKFRKLVRISIYFYNYIRQEFLYQLSWICYCLHTIRYIFSQMCSSMGLHLV